MRLTLLEARRHGDVVVTDSFEIADGGGRDNGAIRSMSINGVEFDQLHLFGWLDGNFTAPRGIVDDLSITAVPEPAGLLMLGSVGLLVLERKVNKRLDFQSAAGV